MNFQIIENVTNGEIPRPRHFEHMLEQYKVARIIRRTTSPEAKGLCYERYGQTILTAGRDFLDGNEMTQNFEKVVWSQEKAKRYHVLTQESWEDYFRREIPVFVLIDAHYDLIPQGYRQIYSDHWTRLYVR